MNETDPKLKQQLALPAADALAEGELAGLFARVAADTVDRRPRVRDRLRELSTPARIGLTIAGAVLMAAVALALVGVRSDLTGQAVVRYGLAMTAVAGLMGAAFSVSLRGAHQRSLGGWAWGLITVALTVPLALAVMPWLWETPAGPAMPVGAPHVFGACGVMGLMTGALTAGVAWVFQREGVPVAWRLLAAVAGGGLTAFAILQLHCPSSDVAHLLVAHAGVGLLLAAVVLVGVALRRRAG